jgi:hypothetical protein
MAAVASDIAETQIPVAETVGIGSIPEAIGRGLIKQGDSEVMLQTSLRRSSSPRREGEPIPDKTGHSAHDSHRKLSISCEVSV